MRRAVVIVTIGLEVKLRIKQRFVRIACQWTEERKLNALGAAHTALLESSPGGCDDDRDLELVWHVAGPAAHVPLSSFIDQ